MYFVFLSKNIFLFVFFLFLFLVPFSALANTPYYFIDAKIQPEKGQLIGRLKLNDFFVTQEDSSIYFYLYPNQIKNSHFKDILVDELGYDLDVFKDNISMSIESVTLGENSLNYKLLNDDFLLQIMLPEDFQPSNNLMIRIDFSVKFPTKGFLGDFGYDGESLFLVDWYPKLVAYYNEEWQIHEPHPFLEHFSNHANYYITLSYPSELKQLVFTGKLISESRLSMTHIMQIEALNAVEFAFYASKKIDLKQKEIEGVQIELLCDHKCKNVERIFEVIEFSLKYFKNSFGPFPFSKLSVVLGKHGHLAGKEYPGMVLVNVDRSWLTTWLPQLEVLLMHEIAHQYWYASVAPDQYRDSWIDEGLATYSHRRALVEYIQEQKLRKRWIYYLGKTERWWTGSLKENESLSEFSDSDHRDDYKRFAYGSGAEFWEQLERCLGQEEMDDFLKTFYKEFKFLNIKTEELKIFLDEYLEDSDYEHCFKLTIQSKLFNIPNIDSLLSN